MNTKPQQIVILAAIAWLAGTPATARANFNWGGDCESGSGEFSQWLEQDAIGAVGTIPANKRNVQILLQSADDVDVQLIDEATGTSIVRWPQGLLNGATEDCTRYQEAYYCYSGYRGANGRPGDEWIRIDGDTNRPLIVRAFGYRAGMANVTYSFAANATCNEKGSGSFSQNLAQGAVAEVGTIDAGTVNVEVQLRASYDLDVQLYHGEVALVQWPNGMLNGAGQQTLHYNGMTIVWSGHEGDGGGAGNEYIRIEGEVTEPLQMKAYGFAAGNAEVTYQWGMGAGDTCMGIATLQCLDGLYCKGVQTDVFDPAGSCHTSSWCDTETVDADCAIVGENQRLVSGNWTCQEFECAWARNDLTLADITTNASFVDELVTITYPVSVRSPICTKIACGLLNQCCNACQSQLRFDNGNAAVTLLGMGCSGNECNVMDSCQYGAGDVVTVTGYVRVTQWGQTQIEVTDSHAADLACSMIDTSCPADFTCNWGCPTAANCGINPQGTCELNEPPNVCEDFSDLDFGMCEMLLGWGIRNNECVPISGCSAQGHTFLQSDTACIEACPAVVRID